MLLDNRDPRIQHELHHLSDHLKKMVDRGDTFDDSLLNKIDDMLKARANLFKSRHGYEFPPLGVFVLPSVKFVICVRKDLEDNEIRAKLIVWLREFTERGYRISASEVATAVINCWPTYRPPIEEFRLDPKMSAGLH